MSSNILDRISKETDLTKSERKIAKIILDDPALVINENIAQLAKRAQVSEPSVCRFCKRFGADGFPAFKLVLSSIVSTSKVGIVQGIKQGDSVEDVIEKVLGQAKHSISKLQNQLDEQNLAKIIDVLSQARRIVVVTQGLNSFVGHDFCAKMLNLGFACEHYQDRNSLSLALSTLRTGDVALCFSATGLERDLIDVCQSIYNGGPLIVSLTPQDSPLYNLSNYQIAIEKQKVEDVSKFVFLSLSMLLYSSMLVGGIMLRRGIAIEDYKDKLQKARLLCDKENEEAKKEQESETQTESLKSNAPITTLNWQPY